MLHYTTDVPLTSQLNYKGRLMTVEKAKYLCGKVIAELELLEECRHKDSGEEENDTPEENIRDVGSMRATGAAHKLASFFNTVLQQRAGENYSDLSYKQYKQQTGFMSFHVYIKTL